jgi:uncharacterized protein YcfL
MQYKHLALCIAAALLLNACSKKSIPESPGKSTVTYNGKVLANTGTSSAKRTVIKRTAATVPKVIVVNDKAAKKNIDGRMYYDVDGHRYWRNYDDGKYYLFNQSMYGNPAFKPH